MYKMCDRAGVISANGGNNGAYGNNYGQYANNAYNRCNDSILVKKELYYVETYARNRETVNACNNAGCYGNNCGNYNNFNNCGAGYRSCGPQCGPVGGCGPVAFGPVGGCGPVPYDKPRIHREKVDNIDNDDDCTANKFSHNGFGGKPCECRNCKNSYKKIFS